MKGEADMNEKPFATVLRSFEPADFEALEGKALTMPTDAGMEALALLLVVNCFRNTVLEDYHSQWPEFADVKMKALMKESVNG